MPEHYRYHIVDRQGVRVESNIPDEYQAQVALDFLKDQNPHEEYSIEREQYYTVTGLGRDPDLHQSSMEEEDLYQDDPCDDITRLCDYWQLWLELEETTDDKTQTQPRP